MKRKYIVNVTIVLAIIALVIWLALAYVYISKGNSNNNPTPIPSPVASVTVSPTATPNQTSLPTPTSTVTPTPSPSKTPTPSPTPATADFSEVYKLPTTQKVVSITFDAGAGTHSTEKILTVLDKHNLKASFFITGKWMEQNPDLLKKIVNKGHEVFNHTYNHPNLTTLSNKDINTEFKTTQAIFKNLTGKSTKPYFRPPYGARDTRVLNVAQNLGYRSIYWTVDALDWKVGITEAEVKSRVLDNLSPGSIYLMHVGDDITGNILDELITKIQNKGYTLTKISSAL